MQTLGLLFKILSFALIIGTGIIGGGEVLWYIFIFTLAAVLFFIGWCLETTPSRSERKRLKRYWAIHGKPRSDKGFELRTRTTLCAACGMFINLYAVTLLYIFIFNEYYTLIWLVVVPLFLLTVYLTWGSKRKYKKALKEFEEIDDTAATE